jgi:serine/threonine-protein kinase RsbW
VDATSLLVPGSEEGLRAARAGFAAFAEARGLRPAATWPFQVALDEVLSNIVRHGKAPSPIQVSLRLTGDVLEMLIEDSAGPFDPLAAPAPDTQAALEARPIGGLGLSLVRGLMDVVEYERVGGANRLTLRRRLRPGG